MFQEILFFLLLSYTTKSYGGVSVYTSITRSYFLISGCLTLVGKVNPTSYVMRYLCFWVAEMLYPQITRSGWSRHALCRQFLTIFVGIISLHVTDMYHVIKLSMAHDMFCVAVSTLSNLTYWTTSCQTYWFDMVPQVVGWSNLLT
jgi:hypothetical protein